MIALTSITPKHIHEDIQSVAIDSWVKLGFKVYSFNNAKEISLLGNKYNNVTFIESKSLEDLYNKPVVGLKSLLDFANESDDEHICLINSDIILDDSSNVLPSIIHKQPSEATIVKRRDFHNDINRNRVFEYGIDVFFIHKNYLHLIKDNNFALGICWWDYTVPYSLIKSGIRVNLLKEPFAYHRMHNVQYSHESWFSLARVFAMLHNVRYKNPMQVNTLVYTEIMNNVI